MRKLIHSLLVLTVILAAFCPAFGGTTPVQAAQPRIRAGQSLDAAEMQAFFDGYLATQMSINHVAGATVSVVKDGQILFAKGYGYADVSQRIPVDPDKTVFILGSLSKLFTWTAVMQLVEQGKLDLNTDVNSYLDFKIPATYPQPITLNNLMAHSAGFEDNKFDQMAVTPETMTPLGNWLQTHIPARVYPPGQYSAYSNYGAALAGYIVARVSGMSYDAYIEKNILSPLAMTHTSSRQPFPALLEADMSLGYLFANGEYLPQPALNVTANVAPAASFRATAGDMARFMFAHLNDGRYGEASILQPATAQLMHKQSYTHDPRVNGMAHGFWEMDMNGQHILGHAGSHFSFNSIMMLFPEHKLGVFIATNSQGGMAFVGGQNYTIFEKAFADHFFPRDVPALTPPADFAQRAGSFSGSYHLTMGRSETTPEKLLALLMAVDVQADKNGLVVPALGNARFIEVEPFVFRQANDDTILIFKEDGAGKINLAYLGPNPQSALIKNHWFETPLFNLTLLGVWLALFLSFEIAAGVAFLNNRRNANTQSTNRLAHAAQVVAGFANVLVLLVLFGAFVSVFNTYGLYIGHLPLWAWIPVLSILVVPLALGMFGFTILAWGKRLWGIGGRIHYTLLTLSIFGAVWFMYFWNILGKSF
jgi:CubicO group peptidase (beta-lactamase class C family)